MSQAYSRPSRESDPYSLPDIEVWQEQVATIECSRCGTFEIPESHIEEGIYCPSCESAGAEVVETDPPRFAWWFWFCLPGCMPDGGVQGPFETEEEALDEAREGYEEEEEE